VTDAPATATLAEHAELPHSGTLKSHFDAVIDLLNHKAELAADFAEWRRQVRCNGLEPVAILQLAHRHLWDAEQRRKAAERKETEELYRQGLGLPLFDYGRQV
jgi:hypothetical protein